MLDLLYKQIYDCMSTEAIIEPLHLAFTLLNENRVRWKFHMCNLHKILPFNVGYIAVLVRTILQLNRFYTKKIKNYSISCQQIKVVHFMKTARQESRFPTNDFYYLLIATSSSVQCNCMYVSNNFIYILFTTTKN